METVIKYLFISVVAVISPVYSIAIGILFLVLSDFITGIWAAKVLKEKIQSKKMRNTIGKLIAYFLLILICCVMDKIFIVPIFSNTLFIKSVALLIAGIEFSSILENFQKITGLSNFKKALIEFLSQNKK